MSDATRTRARDAVEPTSPATAGDTAGAVVTEAAEGAALVTTGATDEALAPAASNGPAGGPV